MAWFWQFKQRRIEQLEDQLQRARDEASSNWEAKVVAENDVANLQKRYDALNAGKAEVEGLLETCQAHRDRALKDVEAQKESLGTMSERVETVANERDAERKQVRDLQAELEHTVEEKNKQDTQNTLLHNRIKTLLEEKEAQRMELQAVRDAEANRPVVEVEVYQSKQGRKATPCVRFIGRYEGHNVALSGPQGVVDMDAAQARVDLLSGARWVIVQRKTNGDGKA